MTRKDFEVIAKALGESFAEIFPDKDIMCALAYFRRYAGKISHTNARFNHDTFITACLDSYNARIRALRNQVLLTFK